MRSLRYVFVALAIGAVAAGPLPSAVAQTAPNYQSSDPEKDAMLDHPPSEVTVTFDKPLDPSSWMNVVDECGNEIDAGAATVNVNELTVAIGDKTPSGMYEVVYKAVGLTGATGSSGSTFEFMVHHGKPCGGGKHPGHHPPGKKKDRHGDHDKNGDRGGDHGGHDDGGGMGSGHSGSDHSDMPASGSTSHSGHTTGPSSNMAAHDTGHGNHDSGPHGGKGPATTTGGTGTPPLATDGTVPVGADGEAVLLGLGLALAVGVLGGWLLRLSSGFAA